ncbi:DMT family transporter [Ramlibacter sp.]|uniref:DMT family transporter n=1 Tax=Ramlibacter sp. TaxID=1917967 RepID=UPI0017D585C1|nr:DMT family transporter [Ramlibacter sp.]MBA2676285.1 DMT family transporter [Ramlibacter sp.]
MHPPATAALRAANRRGVLAMSAGMSSFVANDSLVKYVSESLPSAQLILLRGVFATVLLLGVSYALGAFGQLRALLDRRVMVRAGIDATATLIYLTSLFHLPIGNAAAISMATPLIITLFAILLFKERVGIGRWLAIATGFAGVLMIVQPAGAAFNAYALLCLVGTVFHASRDLLTRTIDPRIPSVVVTLSTAVAVTLFASIWVAFGDWQPVGGKQLALLAAASVFLSAGYYLLIIAMRAGEMSLIVPFRYVGLLVALLLGYLVWRDVPNLLAWCGIALLVAAGCYVLHSQRQATRADLESAPE